MTSDVSIWDMIWCGSPIWILSSLNSSLAFCLFLICTGSNGTGNWEEEYDVVWIWSWFSRVAKWKWCLLVTCLLLLFSTFWAWICIFFRRLPLWDKITGGYRVRSTVCGTKLYLGWPFAWLVLLFKTPPVTSYSPPNASLTTNSEFMVGRSG